MPLLCMPNGRDHYENAREIERLGFGLAIANDSDAATIADAVRRLLSEPAAREACAAFAARNDRYGDLPSALDLIDRARRRPSAGG